MGSNTLNSLLAGMDALPFWLMGAALAVGGTWLLREGSRAFWRLRTVTDTPTSRIQSASQGYVELAGLAEVHQGMLTAPLTGAPCLWHRWRIEERRSRGRGETWVTLERGESDAPFLLADRTGTCLVDPRGAQLHPRRRARWQGTDRHPRGNARQPAWMDLLGLSNRYRFTEERIDRHDPLYVLGRFETPRRGPEERERLRRALLTAWKRDPARMARFDTDGDGRIDAEEWEQARRAAARLAERSEARLARGPVQPRVADTGDPRHPYVISSYTEDELRMRLGRQALGFTAGFLALAVTLGLALLARIGQGD